MRILNRRVVGAVVLGLLRAVALSAQDAVGDVRKAIDGAKDAKAYAGFIADDLRWINADGTVWYGSADRGRERSV